MRLPSLPSSECFGKASSAVEASEPFDELVLSESQVSQVARDIKTQGHCTIAMSKVTQAFLTQLKNDATVEWAPAPNGGVPHKYAGDGGLEPKVKQSAAQIIQALTPDAEPRPLRAQQFELRQPSRGAAPEDWHIDRINKFVVLATLEGKGTLYVSPMDADKVFYKNTDPTNVSAVQKISESEMPKYVQESPQHHFMLFATREIASESVPALIHCSPPATDGRTIFLARWR